MINIYLSTILRELFPSLTTLKIKLKRYSGKYLEGLYQNYQRKMFNGFSRKLIH